MVHASLLNNAAKKLFHMYYLRKTWIVRDMGGTIIPLGFLDKGNTHVMVILHEGKTMIHMSMHFHSDDCLLLE